MDPIRISLVWGERGTSLHTTRSRIIIQAQTAENTYSFAIFQENTSFVVKLYTFITPSYPTTIPALGALALT
jgi:hypothetical protein